MTSDKYSRLNFGEFRFYCKEKGVSALSIINEHYYKEFAEMLVVDYILANTDRHSGNWGFYVNVPYFSLANIMHHCSYSNFLEMNLD